MQATVSRTTKSASLDERNQLVVEHLPMVESIAFQLRLKLPDHVDLDDLIQAGTVGLLDAVDKYDPQKAVAFRAYAKHRIKGAILDSLRQADWASRQGRRRRRSVEAVTHELLAELGRLPAEAEVADRLCMSLEDLRRMMIDLRIEFVSATQRSSDREDALQRDFPDKKEARPESLCARKELRQALERAINTLPDRERKMLGLYYNDEFSMKTISQMFGIHESRTSQIFKAVLQKMANNLQAAGIRSSQPY
jgi:RNA polymerase sigma factor for flagellar operon FliA